MNQDEIIANEVLRGLVGSTAHGTGLDGQEDRDEMGVFVEPPDFVMGLSRQDHLIYRTAPDGVRSGPDDLDLTLYSLRKFGRLCAEGNPSVLLLLHLPDYITLTEAGRILIADRHLFVSREAGKKFLGYLRRQKASVTGERGAKVQRHELVKQFGFDTKFAMHALRLGLQGVEFLSTGRISVPVAEPERTFLRDVRSGRYSLPEVMDAIERAESSLAAAVEATDRQVDVSAIDRLIRRAHEAHWGGGCVK